MPNTADETKLCAAGPTEEIPRLPNEPVEYAGSRHWDVMRLSLEVRRALGKLEEFELSGIGVDAWGVDYARLGERGEFLQNPYHDRDSRTDGRGVCQSSAGGDLRRHRHLVHANQDAVPA